MALAVTKSRSCSHDLDYREPKKVDSSRNVCKSADSRAGVSWDLIKRKDTLPRTKEIANVRCGHRRRDATASIANTVALESFGI